MIEPGQYEKAIEIIREAMDKVRQAGFDRRVTFELNAELAMINIRYIPKIFNINNDKGGVNMADISSYTKAQSAYLKAKDVVDSKTKVFTISAEATIVDKDFNGKKSQKVSIEGTMDEKEYIFEAGKINAAIIAKALGSDTKKWIGSQLVFETYKTKNDKNVLVDAIAVKEVKKIM